MSGAEGALQRLGARRGPAGAPFLRAEETAAGERLARDWARAALTPKVTQSWSGLPAGGGGGGSGAGDVGDMAMDATARVRRALHAAGPELSGILVDVCCLERGLEEVERERQWPRRSAKLLLKAALSVLARHYGLVHESEAAPSRLRAWRGG